MEPPERNETARDALCQALRAGPLTVRELSQRVGLAERDVLHHLEHLERSLRHTREQLMVEPARCVACGYAFEARTRLGKPGRCPACRATRIAPPRYAVVADQ
ncbi:MAG TPA: transcriptional regulator [Polyangiales bacterium]|nr:transcriptional regulator [Polyangiales bacterium]